MSYTVQTRNMGTIPSVRRRRVTGPYKPCPRAKRVLMEKQDIVNTQDELVQNNESASENISSALEENIDFAVESSKIDDAPAVIELDTEDEVDDNEDVDITENNASLSEEQDLPNGESPESPTHQVSNEIEENDETINDTENYVAHVSPSPILTVPQVTPTRLSLQNSKSKTTEVKTFKLPNGMSPKIVLERTPSRIIHTSDKPQKHAICYKTFMSHNHELRHFQIVMKHCHSRNNSSSASDDESSVKSYSLRESRTPIQKSPNKSKTARISSVNIIKPITCDVSTPEFIDKYESKLAKKFELLKQCRQQNFYSETANSKQLSEGKLLERPVKTQNPPNSPSRTRDLTKLPLNSFTDKMQVLQQPSLINSKNLTFEAPRKVQSVSSENNLSLTLNQNASSRAQNKRATESVTMPKQPVHPRTRLRLSPMKRPTRQVNILNYVLSQAQRENYVELSDSDTESQSSLMTFSEVGDVKVEVKEEGEDNDDDDDDVNDDDDDDDDVENDEDENDVSTITDDSEKLDSSDIYIKPEIKNEIMDAPTSYYIESDEEISASLLDAYRTVERRRRKVSSNRRVESVVTGTEKSPSKQGIIGFTPVISHQKYPTNYIQQYSSSSSTDTNSTYQSPQTDGLISNVQITLVKLSIKTIDNLIHLCKTSATWNNNSLLEKAGMSWYDIHRLGTMSRTRKVSSYGLRQFVKKNRKIFEAGTIKKPRPPSALKGIKMADRKALKRKLKIREKKKQLEKKRQDEESIRRALLRINARVMSQNRFWAFLNQGSSQEHPIVI